MCDFLKYGKIVETINIWNCQCYNATWSLWLQEDNTGSWHSLIFILCSHSKKISEEDVGNSIMDNYCGSKNFLLLVFIYPQQHAFFFIRWTVRLYFHSYLASGKESITIFEYIYQIWGLILNITSLVMYLLFCRDQMSHCWFLHVWIKPD